MHGDDRDEYELVIGRPAEATLAIGSRRLVYGGDYAVVPYRLDARGVVARGNIELAPWNRGEEALANYFDSLDEAWRGWEGSKDWSDFEGFGLSATHDGVGTISLTVTIQSADALTWDLRAVVAIEAGSSLHSMAARLRRLLEADAV